MTPQGVSGPTYFSTVMANEILMLNRKVVKNALYASLETIIHIDVTGNILDLENLLADEHDTIAALYEQLMAEEIIALVGTLESRSRMIIKMYLEGAKQQEIGKRLNMSQSYVSRMIAKTIRELKNTYAKGA